MFQNQILVNIKKTELAKMAKVSQSTLKHKPDWANHKISDGESVKALHKLCEEIDKLVYWITY